MKAKPSAGQARRKRIPLPEVVNDLSIPDDNLRRLEEPQSACLRG
jgi:hypothetical protein